MKKGKSEFPVDHHSAWSLVLFGANPIMYKILCVNRQVIDSTTGITGVIGKAFHRAMQTYYGGNDDVLIANENEAIAAGLRVGLEYIADYNDGWIRYSKDIPNKEKAQAILAFAFNAYVKETPYSSEEIVSIEEKIQESVSVEWRGKAVELPVALKGYTDKIVRRDGKLVIVDYKTARSFSDPDKIDGAKIIQAVQYYFLVYAKYGEEPYAIEYEEVKTTENREKKDPQVKRFTIVFAENESFFDFYFRYYDDVNRALMGEQVFVPNVHALYDGDVGIVSYIHRLDHDEEVAKQMKKLKVENITDLLKKKIHSATSMKRFLATVEKNFISAKNLNYEKMEVHEKIQTKLMEHGLMLQFDSKIEGHAFDLYRYTPSIGLKMSKLRGYAADVEQVMGRSGIRVLAPIPNDSRVGFEVPKENRTFPGEAEGGMGHNVSIGVDVMGNTYRFDLTNAPHMLVAGASGSGKSVFLNSVIRQLLKAPNTDLHLFDPKIIELAQWKDEDGVVEYQSDPGHIAASLSLLVDEMERRYKTLASKKVKNISETTGMSYKFIVIDEFGDLGGKEIPESIRLLSQKARAAGIHLIIATQRPSVDVISGTIKSNFPTKAVFRTAKAVDSIVVMDEPGAEKLLGKGDMLFSAHDGVHRLQGYRA